MAGRLTLRILTPAREVLAREVDSATLTAAAGEVGLLPGHAAFLAELRPGHAQFTDGDETEFLALADGFLEVSDDVVTALVRSAEPADEIDEVRAERRRAERQAQLERGEVEGRELEHAERSLAKQMVRLDVANRRS